MKSSDTNSSQQKKSKKNTHRKILIQIVIAIIIGIFVGGFFPQFAIKFSLLGKIFLNSLMMIVVPLVMCSMIVGITGLGDIRSLGSIGKHTIIYYFVTTGLSVLIGIFLVNIIKPGKDISTSEKHDNIIYEIAGENHHKVVLKNNTLIKQTYNDKYSLLLLDQNITGIIDSVSRSCIYIKFWMPHNSDDILFIKTKSGDSQPFILENKKLISAEPQLQGSGKGFEITLSLAEDLKNRETNNISSTLQEVLIGNKETGNEGLIPRNIFNAMVRMDILPLIVFSLLLGAALSIIGKSAENVIKMISSLNDAMMKLIDWIMRIAPYGIFGLITARIGEAGGFENFIPELLAVGKYSLTVLIGLSIHGFIVLPLILFLFTHRNPLQYFSGVAAALLNAFSTASSSATLPLTISGVEKENNISSRSAGFVLPLGATINMDGTALYEAVAALFIAQIYSIPLGPIEQCVIFLTATLAAIGAAGIPQAGLVTMVIVLKAVNLPVEGIGIILTVDWLLDRFRTTVNVWGDSIGAAVVDRLEEKKS